MSDLYELIGVERGATADEIKKAYRKRARELHPDQNPDDPDAEARFKSVAQAYEVLSDPEKRARYDRFGTTGSSGGGFGAGGDPFAGGGLGDIFEAFFGAGGGGAQQRSNQGVDLETIAELDLADTITGINTEVTVRTAVACETCDSTGAAPGAETNTCVQCAGSGQVRQVRQSILGQMVTTAACPRCAGEGRVISEVCGDCSGEGRRIEDRSYTVEIPPGVSHGTTLRLTGRGAVGPRGGPPGDLFVEVRVNRHPSFARDNDRLLSDLHVAMTQAALGATVQFESIDGPVEVTVPPGSQAGRIFKVRERGIPKLRGRGRGDLILTLVVDTPTELTEEEQVLLRNLAGLRGEEVSDPPEGLLNRIKQAFT